MKQDGGPGSPLEERTRVLENGKKTDTHDRTVN